MDNEVKDEKQTSQKETKKPQDNPLGKKAPKFNMNWVYGIIAIVLLGFMFMSPMGGETIEIQWPRFENEMLSNHDVSRIVVVNKEKAEVYIKPEKLNEERYNDAAKQKPGAYSPQYFFTIGSVEMFEKKLEEATKDYAPNEQVPVSYETRQNNMNTIFNWISSRCC